MTEKEKMLSGMTYNSGDPELERERARCKDLCFEFNNTPPSQGEKMRDIIRRLFGRTGECFEVSPIFWCDYGYNVEIGDFFYANHNLILLDVAKIVFGHHVLIGPNCGFYTASHPIDYQRRNVPVEFAYPITVGDNVWFGAGVHVMPGVTVGSNVVIGAGSVVTKDIPDNVVALGSPCHVLRPITEKDRETQWDLESFLKTRK